MSERSELADNSEVVVWQSMAGVTSQPVGLIVLESFVSPFHAERGMARELFGAGDFVEVCVDTPLADCERRDPMGLYKKARKGPNKNFTGIDSDYEPPEHAEVRLRTPSASPDEFVGQILSHIDRH